MRTTITTTLTTVAVLAGCTDMAPLPTVPDDTPDPAVASLDVLYGADATRAYIADLEGELGNDATLRFNARTTGIGTHVQPIEPLFPGLAGLGIAAPRCSIGQRRRGLHGLPPRGLLGRRR